MNALEMIRAATEPTESMTWSAFCARFHANHQAVTRSHGRRYGVEVHRSSSAGPQDGTIFIQDLDAPPAKRELLSFRIMNNQLTLQSHGNYLFSVSIYEALRKHPTPTSLVKYLFDLVDEYAGGSTNAEAAAEPESLGERGMSNAAFTAQYARFVSEAWTAFKRTMMTGRRYYVQDKSKSKIFQVGLEFRSTPTVANALIITPSNYDTREDHVNVGYYAVQQLAAAHSIIILHIQSGKISKQFAVPAPRLDSKFLTELMNKPEEGKRAFIGLRVNAVLTAVLADIAKLRTAAGYTNTARGPAYWYDLNNFHYSGSNFRPEEMAG